MAACVVVPYVKFPSGVFAPQLATQRFVMTEKLGGMFASRRFKPLFSVSLPRTLLFFFAFAESVSAAAAEGEESGGSSAKRRQGAGGRDRVFFS